MLNIKKTLTKILGHAIMEQGTSGIWTYRKWADGTAECWAYTNKSVTGVNTPAPFSGYNYDCGAFAFPTGLFIAVPSATVNGRKGGNYTCVSYVNASITQIAIELQSSISGTDTCHLYIHAIGKWK